MKQQHLQQIRKNESMDFIDETIRQEIPRTIARWIMRNISCPIEGFDSKKNFDGTCYSIAQQLEASREQLFLIALDYCDRGYTSDGIIQRLKYFQKG